MSDQSRSASRRANYQSALAKSASRLDLEQERELARQWRAGGDRRAAEALVRAHLRTVTSLAVKYRHYGLPIAELIAEGNCGLVHALGKFDPERKFRRERAVNRRFESVDVSLDAPAGDGQPRPLVDRLPASDDPEQALLHSRAAESVALTMRRALRVLDRRERYIIEAKAMAERGDELSFADMARVLKISRERVRQLEARALDKLRAAVASSNDPTVMELVSLRSRAVAAAGPPRPIRRALPANQPFASP